MHDESIKRTMHFPLNLHSRTNYTGKQQDTICFLLIVHGPSSKRHKHSGWPVRRCWQPSEHRIPIFITMNIPINKTSAATCNLAWYCELILPAVSISLYFKFWCTCCAGSRFDVLYTKLYPVQPFFCIQWADKKQLLCSPGFVTASLASWVCKVSQYCK